MASARPAILVNSAREERSDAFLDITPETSDLLLAVNLTGTFNCCQAVLPDMIEQGWGRIVNITSSSMQSGAPRMAHYVASNSGVLGLTKCLALEFGPHGITVNTVPPGFIDTPVLRAVFASVPWTSRRRSRVSRCVASGHPRTSPPRACSS